MIFVPSPSLNIYYLNMFARAKLSRANVNFCSAPIKDGTTGTVIVLTTPDAQRTMLAYQVRFYEVFVKKLQYHFVSETFNFLRNNFYQERKGFVFQIIFKLLGSELVILCLLYSRLLQNFISLYTIFFLFISSDVSMIAIV